MGTEEAQKHQVWAVRDVEVFCVPMLKWHGYKLLDVFSILSSHFLCFPQAGRQMEFGLWVALWRRRSSACMHKPSPGARWGRLGHHDLTQKAQKYFTFYMEDIATLLVARVHISHKWITWLPWLDAFYDRFWMEKLQNEQLPVGTFTSWTCRDLNMSPMCRYAPDSRDSSPMIGTLRLFYLVFKDG